MEQPPPRDAATPTTARRDAGVLAGGSLLGGLLAYVFFALVTRALGAAPAAPVAVLWAWWGFAGAALTFPIQHWISRTSALPGGEAAVRRGLAHVAAGVAGMSLVAGALAWLARERLFGVGNGEEFPLLVVAVGLGSGLLGVVRGTLSGRRRFGDLAVNLVLENGLRCVVAGALMATGVQDPTGYGLALLAGYAVTFLRPAALVPRRTGTGDADAPLAFLSGASAGQLLAQVTLTGGPVLVAALGGAPAHVTALFAGLALFRAPYTLALGLVAALTGRVTELVRAGHRHTLARIRRLLVVATTGTAVAAAGVAAWIGPEAMELVFGAGVRLQPDETALVAVGSVFALANLVLTIGLLARGRSAGVARTWLLAAPFGVAAHLLVGSPALLATCWTFLVVEAVAWAGFLLLEVRSDRLLRDEPPRA